MSVHPPTAAEKRTSPEIAEGADFGPRDRLESKSRARLQKRTFNTISLDYLIRPLQQFGWHCNPNLPSRPEIDDQNMTREDFDRQVGWFGTLKNLVHVCWNARERV